MQLPISEKREWRKSFSKLFRFFFPRKFDRETSWWLSWWWSGKSVWLFAWNVYFKEQGYLKLNFIFTKWDGKTIFQIRFSLFQLLSFPSESFVLFAYLILLENGKQVNVGINLVFPGNQETNEYDSKRPHSNEGILQDKKSNFEAKKKRFVETQFSKSAWLNDECK